MFILCQSYKNPQQTTLKRFSQIIYKSLFINESIRGLDKREWTGLSSTEIYLNYYSTKSYVVGTQKNRLTEFECRRRILEHEKCPLSRALKYNYWTELKTLWQMEKSFIMNNSSVFHNVFNSCLLQRHQKSSPCGKDLTLLHTQICTGRWQLLKILWLNMKLLIMSNLYFSLSFQLYLII